MVGVEAALEITAQAVKVVNATNLEWHIQAALDDCQGSPRIGESAEVDQFDKAHGVFEAPWGGLGRRAPKALLRARAADSPA
ncbi:hypothetical protein D9M71_375200 [compost metagenome]